MRTGGAPAVGHRCLQQTEVELGQLRAPAGFAEGELEDLPPGVRRYMRASIAPGTPLAQAARLTMHGSVKQGPWWLPFRARQIVAPLHGFAWEARVAGGVLAGSDRYLAGTGVMDWRLFGLIRVIHAEGPDMAHSSAGRAAAEAVWVPTAMLPRFGVTWSTIDSHHVVARYPLDRYEMELHYRLDDEGLVRAVSLDRWGGPGRRGLQRFVHELTEHATFGGVTVPCAGRGGWFGATDRWSEAEFFRYRITDLELVG